MSIILKGIDLPKKQCLLVFIADNGAVVCSGEDGVTTTEAIQIPKGHGRLIDADKLTRFGDVLLSRTVDIAPTILESEVMPDE